jgi:guanine nucleotide-binding protein G(i) subunit alpha
MKIIHQGGFTPEELLAYRLTVYRNVLESAQAIVGAMGMLGVDWVNPANRVHLTPLIFSHSRSVN